jgi:hypothetical protein
VLGGSICLGLLLVTPAHAGLLCTVFKYCLYEGVPFTIKVVDKETGSPLPNVHALAEWLQQGRFGAGGPVMVQDAVSGPDGVLTFPAWGPLRGSPDGLLVYEAPVITRHARKPCPLGRGGSHPCRGIIKGAGGPLYPAPWWPSESMTEYPRELARE